MGAMYEIDAFTVKGCDKNLRASRIYAKPRAE